ncbi:TRAP transporter large permease subunit [Kordiimonas sp. SCSIO 12603]|uniref:TRAP transporter large permease n=1 Tax=Kordiimonas sp. SCSIO 12603 TaxID=2829596 RepID=UPI0021061014|nr:TRAP transporter large permease subunit [Kordiimonas sp. SCSIO 12603]UTW57076.1 TRAP transporter large permease subunit [Kordiimonas sp. SCSIO 12603]
MDMSLILTISMFITLVGFLLSGFPVAFTLGGTGLLFGLIGMATGTLDFTFLEILPNRLFSNVIRNELLFAIPLFVSMGVMLEKSNVAEDLLENMGRLFGPLRGGLGISVTIVGALLAASTGIVGATVVTMGLLSLPTMMRRGYDTSLATGSIAAAGTLGQIIPPSIVLILLADVLSSAWQQAQLNKGVFSPTPMSAGELFAGALLPGLVLVGLYILYQVVIAILKPDSSPAIPREEGEALDKAFYGKLLIALLPPLVLIVAVLGSILSGIATPTEAASVGAIGAILLGAARLDTGTRRFVFVAVAALLSLLFIASQFDLRQSREIVPTSDVIAFWAAIILTAAFFICLARALWKTYKSNILNEVMLSTVRISTMIYAILIGASLFALVFRGLGGDDIIEGMLHNLPGGQFTAILLVMVLMFVLGFFLDFIEITFVVVPVVAPALLAMDGTYGPIWLGVLMAMNLQTSFLTPPFGFALFYLRGVVPETVPTSAIYKGVIPFVIIQILALALIAAFPETVTWLPEQLF